MVSWEQAFFDIDLEMVPMPLLPSDWRGSKGHSREEMQGWIEHLKEIERLRSQHGYEDVNFENMRSSKNPRDRSLGQTYHKFYHHSSSGRGLNADFIRVDWVGDHYEVVNGNKRIWLAKQSGIRRIPARVSAPDARTLQRLMNEQARSSREEPWERGKRTGHAEPKTRRLSRRPER